MAASGENGCNYKSQLQQFAQREFGSTPTYQLLDEKGPDHSKCFKISAQIGRDRYQPAWGRNKKEAEQRAARNALERDQRRRDSVSLGLNRRPILHRCRSMTVRAVALLSGGLDSMLAIRILQMQGIEVEALNFRTTFTCCQDQAAEAADELGRADCRSLPSRTTTSSWSAIRDTATAAGRIPASIAASTCSAWPASGCARSGAALVVSGEVVGQRPMSQKKRDLALIAHRAGLDRPPVATSLGAVAAADLCRSASGLVDRERFFGFSGRGRTELIALAHNVRLLGAFRSLRTAVH